MLNFAEQTGSGAVMLVWSFPLHGSKVGYTNKLTNTYSLVKVIYSLDVGSNPTSKMSQKFLLRLRCGPCRLHSSPIIILFLKYESACSTTENIARAFE